MNDKDVKRINELYHKSKDIGLTVSEKEEQAKLRKEYIESVRRNMRGSLNNVSIVNTDGSITNLKDVYKSKSK